MSSFENTLERMKNLYTYGKELNESSKSNAYTLEHSAVAADGKTYGIIRECNKFYIKSAQKGKERIAESYEYIGGFCNKKNYEYTSYNNALKNFELKMASINEACDGKVNISTLDPFKKGEFIVEGTDKMRDEIARQRQIMFNVAMLMNEGTDIGASRKDDVVMNRDANPEGETGKKGDECVTDKKGDANPEYKGSKTNGVDKKVAPFNNNAPKCADQLKENCDCDSDSCDCKNDWGTEGIGKGRDPKSVGWDIEGQQVVNEEENDWGSEGLPSTPGVGEADTDHNNAPFNNSINEEDDVDFSDDVEDDVDMDDDVDGDFGMEGDDDVDFDMGDDEDIDFGGDDLDFDGENELDSELNSDDESDFDVDAEDGDDDILAQIEELQAQIDALRAKIDGDVDVLDGEEDVLDGEEEILDGEEDVLGGEEDVLDGEEDFEGEDDFGGDDDFEGEDDFADEDGFDGEDDFEGEDEESLMESKRRMMDSIVESVVSSLLKEDELHAFGKHPGYQKKPMELPSTGEDKNQWGEDWNDESVHSEEPFGTKIGDSTPFVDKLVDAVSKDVMKKLSEAANGKKKVK